MGSIELYRHRVRGCVLAFDPNKEEGPNKALVYPVSERAVL